MIRDGWTAEKAIERALTSIQPNLGLSADEARHCRDLIEATDRDDDDALRAHDLLHTRLAHGCAW